MKTKFQLRIVSIVELSIFLLLVAMFAGCEKDPVDNPDNPVNVVMQDLALQGIVKDANGAPLSGIKVTTGSLNVTTNNDGAFAFTQAGTVDNRAVVKFEKSDYFTLTRSGARKDTMYIDAMMYPKGNNAISLQVDFDASKPKTLEKGGLKIDLPAGCFANADGSPYSGTVRADILYLAAGSTNMRNMMPGGDMATTDKEVLMLPAGIADVNFSDAAGKPLKIADKMNATVTCALPANVNAADLPATVSGWTFDEARGLWREEGAATLSGKAYTGKVTHFSPYGIGPHFNMKYATILWVIAKECDNKPAAGATITFEHTYVDHDGDALGSLVTDFWPDGVFYTDENGFCTVFVPQQEDVEITGKYKGQTRTATVRSPAKMATTEVEFKFDDNCGSEGNLVFNLKPGPNSNSAIIEVLPAMPEPLYGLMRYTPDAFCGSLGGFKMDKIKGNPNGLGIAVTSIQWNADYTECTYVFKSIDGYTWRGTVNLYNIDPDFLAGVQKNKAYKINSVTVGFNNPLSIIIVNPLDGY